METSVSPAPRDSQVLPLLCMHILSRLVLEFYRLGKGPRWTTVSSAGRD
jgi:hypothetical protein